MSRSWTHLIGRAVSFDHEGKRLVGTITEASDAGLSQPGNIPDAVVVIRGQSGKTISVSVVSSNLQLIDPNAP